jgi:hypothetical protein
MPGCDFPSRSFLKFQPYCFSWGQVKTIEGLRRTKFLIQLQKSLKATRLLELADTASVQRSKKRKRRSLPLALFTPLKKPSRIQTKLAQFGFGVFPVQFARFGGGHYRSLTSFFPDLANNAGVFFGFCVEDFL